MLTFCWISCWYFSRVCLWKKYIYSRPTNDILEKRIIFNLSIPGTPSLPLWQFHTIVFKAVGFNSFIKVVSSVMALIMREPPGIIVPLSIGVYGLPWLQKYSFLLLMAWLESLNHGLGLGNVRVLAPWLKYKAWCGIWSPFSANAVFIDLPLQECWVQALTDAAFESVVLVGPKR